MNSGRRDSKNGRIGLEISDDSARPDGPAGLSIRDGEPLYRALVANIQDGLFLIADHRLLLVNEAFAQMVGYPLADLIGQEFLDFVAPEDRDLVVDRYRRRQAGEDLPSLYDFRLLHRDGETRIHVLMSVGVMPLDDGRMATVGTLKDITEAKQAEEALRDSEERFRNLVEGSIQGIIVHRDFKPLFFNKALAEIFGYASADDILALDSYLDLIAPHERDRLLGYAALRRMGREAPRTYEYEGLRKDGSVVWVENRVRRITWRDGPATQSTLVDITQRKRAQEQILHLASHDPLTGLPNRALGRDRLMLALARARRSGSRAAVLFIDLDGFKAINDSLGHATGDDLLAELARRLSAGVRESDTVARYGGDEFLFVLFDIDDDHAAERVAEMLLATVSRPLQLQGREVSVGASIGIAVFPDHGDTPEALLSAADAAMYAAKQSGRNRYRFAETA